MQGSNVGGPEGKPATLLEVLMASKPKLIEANARQEDLPKALDSDVHNITFAKAEQGQELEGNKRKSSGNLKDTRKRQRTDEAPPSSQKKIRSMGDALIGNLEGCSNASASGKAQHTGVPDAGRIPGKSRPLDTAKKSTTTANQRRKARKRAQHLAQLSGDQSGKRVGNDSMAHSGQKPMGKPVRADGGRKGCDSGLPKIGRSDAQSRNSGRNLRTKHNRESNTRHMPGPQIETTLNQPGHGMMLLLVVFPIFLSYA